MGAVLDGLGIRIGEVWVRIETERGERGDGPIALVVRGLTFCLVMWVKVEVLR